MAPQPSGKHFDTGKHDWVQNFGSYLKLVSDLWAILAVFYHQLFSFAVISMINFL